MKSSADAQPTGGPDPSNSEPSSPQLSNPQLGNPSETGEHSLQRSALPFLVGVGACPGCSGAVRAFFESLPPGCKAAFFVVTAPEQEGAEELEQVLRRSTEMPVQPAEDGTALSPGCIYLLQGGARLRIEEGKLQLRQAGAATAALLPIDSCFLAIAGAAGPSCAAIILSGRGSDGSRGIGAVQRAGGLTLIQDPSGAQVDEMPCAAGRTITPDHLLHPTGMARPLVTYAEMIHGGLDSTGTSLQVKVASDPLQRMLLLLLSEEGVDFRHYRTRTVRRQIQRRMTVLGMENADDYHQLLQRDRVERRRLLQRNLEWATEFFRDGEAFDLLGEHVLPALVEEATEQSPIQLWVPGCSTGEEAYSLAMLLEEALAAAGKGPFYRIIATDLDPRAIQRAEEGRYPGGIAPHISRQRLESFFDRRGDGYQVCAELRERVRFSVHNLVADAPFEEQHLITCRNLLNYFSPSLQDQALQALGRGLRPEGHLLLGESDAPMDHEEEWVRVPVGRNLLRRRQCRRSEEDTGSFPRTMIAGDTTMSGSSKVSGSNTLAGSNTVAGGKRGSKLATGSVGQLMHSTGFGTISVDRSLHIRSFTALAAELVDLEEDHVGGPLDRLQPLLRGPELPAVAGRVLRSGVEESHELSCAAGRSFLLRALPSHSGTAGETEGVVLTFTQLCGLEKSEPALPGSEEHLRQLAHAIEEVFYMAELDGELTYVSPAYERIWGEEAPSRFEGAFLGAGASLPEDRQRVEQLATGSTESGFECEYRIRDLEGNLRWISERTYPVLDSSGEPVRMAGLAKDITPRKLQEEQLLSLSRELESQVHEDSLTGLLNRRGLEKALATEMKAAARTGQLPICVLVDLDRFKAINDTVGHAAGDVVINHVGQRMVSALRPSDSLARIGGDEFLILLKATRVAEAVQIAERVRLAISDSPVKVSSRSLRVTASLGVTQITPDVVSMEEVLRLTHRALLRSKESGKNRISVGNHGSARLSDVASADPLQILQVDRLNAYAQSIHNLEDGGIEGYEMLSRGPEGAYFNPDDFFRLSLEHNALTVIDMRCLKACLSTSMRLPDHGHVHVNLYPSSLLDTPTESLIKLFEEAGGCKRFCVEISEQQFLGDPAYLREPVERLREAGIQIAIDDVGFGRSSLESLIVLEPDVVKIDRAFVRDCEHDPARRRNLQRLVRAIEALSSLGLAEGVENEQQIEILLTMGLRYAQGFHWARPQPVP